MPDILPEELTDDEVRNLAHAKVALDNLNKFRPTNRLQGRIAADAKNLLRLAVRIANAGTEDELDSAVEDITTFLE